MVVFGAVKEKEYSLIETGEYVLTLSDLEESVGQYGDRLIWKWLVAPVSDPTAYICNGSGSERTVWAFTDPDIIIGSLQHQFVECLSGRAFGKDEEPPTEEELLGRRVIGYITHHTPKQGKNAGKKQEQIVAGSIKPFKGPQPNKVIYTGTPQPSADAPAVDPARTDLIAKAERIVGKAVRLETPSHLEWARLDFGELADDALTMVIRDAQAEVNAALDA